MSRLQSLPTELQAELRKYTQKEREALIVDYVKTLDDEYRDMLFYWDRSEVSRLGAFLAALPMLRLAASYIAEHRLRTTVAGGLLFGVGTALLGYSVALGSYLRYRRSRLLLNLIKLKHGA